MCRSARGGRGARGQSQRGQTYQVEAEPEEEDLINSVGASCTSKPYTAVDGKPVTMQIDTGAVVSLISQVTQETLFPEAVLTQPELELRTAPISVLGQMRVS